MKKTAFIILGIVLAAQLLIPASMILKHERILRTGELYRFKTRPIDPADPFQGRYVWLGFENDYIPGINKNEPSPKYNERVFVSLGAGSDDLCVLKSWSRTQPETGDYLKLKYTGTRTQWNPDTKKSTYMGLRFHLPFNRFYMDENKAKRAERIVRRTTIDLFEPANTNLVTNCWANVRVLNGAALIEDVLVDGTPIRELAGEPSE